MSPELKSKQMQWKKENTQKERIKMIQKMNYKIIKNKIKKKKLQINNLQSMIFNRCLKKVKLL